MPNKKAKTGKTKGNTTKKVSKRTPDKFLEKLSKRLEGKLETLLNKAMNEFADIQNEILTELHSREMVDDDKPKKGKLLCPNCQTWVKDKKKALKKHHEACFGKAA